MKIREIPFLALGGVIAQDDIDATNKVISAAAKGGNFFPMPEENDFQNAFAGHEGAENAIAVNSCGTALDCCMMALEIKEGDEVITTPLTFVCSAGTAIGQGAKVVFADIDETTMNLNPVKVREKITNWTKAIIAVHFTGLACNIDGFDKIAAETGIPVIYDAAHAVGTKYQGSPIGGRGKATCYSFQSNKNMTCLGEGGAVTTNDPEFGEKVRQLKTFGYVYGGPSLRVASIGFNYRMTKPQYAVGLTQLAKIDAIIKVRQQRMVQLNNLLADVSEVILPAGHGPGHGSHLYVLRLNTDKVAFTTEEFRKRLLEKYKVGTAKHYPPVWSWEAFADLGYNGEGCPLAAKACAQVISMPIFPGTREEDVEYIAWAVKETLADLKRG
ncbi:MAG: DegT/DnrJ/EryC1/StrS family aminotransferase [Victivallaceae bacterium]|nr:DegT/DnrJ/EryC1/StrS family aminotransferase [Victivallaceae bacterium]